MYKKSSWTFSEEVSHQFDHHVRQSVPFYDLIQSSIVELSDYFVTPSGLIYDLGCSTGETIALIEKRHPTQKLRYIGIDNSESMVQQASMKNKNNHRTTFKVQSLETYSFEEKSRFILSILTLQFIPIEKRKQIIQNIYENLHEGGACVIVEKTLASSSLFQDIFTHLQYDMKMQSGLSPKEIFLKEESLRGIMTPLSLEDNMQLLVGAGFDVEIFMKHWKFTGFLAVKPHS
ncbi:tRNA (cmo5U34)-methyltransferase [Paenibacillus sp. 1182]|uniref:methyltransferase domain-containing protein n=1 Tax=Paenibacillus sp. 1182 TaxID=2806565 RepID=UPI001AEA2558|nr:methyltransferase domain-containing protein [Paenibacillus sp. 1182]MBP1308716.1 tRNA (cmo5U34)-methyltransferase [Paenibacillus sp. 1182]